MGEAGLGDPYFPFSPSSARLIGISLGWTRGMLGTQLGPAEHTYVRILMEDPSRRPQSPEPNLMGSQPCPLASLIWPHPDLLPNPGPLQPKPGLQPLLGTVPLHSGQMKMFVENNMCIIKA